MTIQLYTTLRVPCADHTHAGWYIAAVVAWSRAHRHATGRLLRAEPCRWLRDELDAYADAARCGTERSVYDAVIRVQIGRPR